MKRFSIFLLALVLPVAVSVTIVLTPGQALAKAKAPSAPKIMIVFVLQLQVCGVDDALVLIESHGGPLILGLHETGPEIRELVAKAKKEGAYHVYDSRASCGGLNYIKGEA